MIITVINMFDQLIQEVFHTSQYTIEKLEKGLTNHNYLVHVNDELYVLRIPHEDSSHIIDRKREKIVHDLVRRLDVECIYFNEENGVKITKYEENLYEYKECPYIDKIERCANLMKILHSIPAPTFHFDPFKTLETYRSCVKKPLYDLSIYEDRIEAVKHFHNKEVLCHNDFVSGNILFGKYRDYLIDYEYGASNDPLFDVISFLSENNIFDKALRARFYKVYFGTMDDTLKKQLYLWEMFQNVLWCHWAMMMYESRKDKVYKEIAHEKYEALLKMDNASLWF